MEGNTGYTVLKIYYITCPVCLGTGKVKIFTSGSNDFYSITDISYSEDPCENCKETGQIEVRYD